MKVACDADGLIKMVKAGILEAFAKRVELVVGPRVYHETVEEGKARGYPDALQLERILKEHARVRRPKRRGRAPADRTLEAFSLGAGERETLELYLHERAEAILSDDRGFLNRLAAREIPYLTPAAALVLLATQGTFTRKEAWEALERLRPLIRRDQYEAAHQDLQTLEERGKRG